MSYRIVWIEVNTGKSGESRLRLSREWAAALMVFLQTLYPNRIYDIEPVTLRKELK